MLESAGHRFWRGVREPWDLLRRMRGSPALWARYWRTVGAQVALTLVAGLAVFWVGKQGADAWNDAFGPEEPAESSPAARTAPPGAPANPPGEAPTRRTGAAQPADTAPAPAAPGGPSGAAGPDDTASPPASPPPPGRQRGTEKASPHPPAAPPTAPALPAPAPTSSAPAGKAAPGAVSRDPAPASRPDGADEEADGDTEPSSDDSVESALEAKIRALQDAPPDERGQRTAELVAAALEKAKKEASRAERRAGTRKGKADTSAQDLQDERESLGDALTEVAIAAEALSHDPSKSAADSRRARRHLERKLDEVETEAAALQKRGAPGLSPSERARLDRARAALLNVRRHERGLSGRIGAVLALLAAIYASLGIAQTGVLALSRDFHDALSRELSLLVHVAPEDPPMRPKIRLDLPWVRRKANRRAQFFLGFLPGTALIWVIGTLIPPHRTLKTVLTTMWAAYWWMVMTAGQSARAWSPPDRTPRPWYLRAWFSLTDRVFLFRWGLPRLWGRLWERMARRFYGPSERVEEQPLEFAGLGLSRALTLIPGVKLLLRPVFPVCAAHLLVEHAAAARLPVPVTAAEVATAAARAPDPEARAHSGAPTPTGG